MSVEDLIHEENLGTPILQIALGRFIPGTQVHIALAVLHPRKLTVFELTASSTTGRVMYYTLSKLYEHRLGDEGKHFTAFNMTVGPFGGVSGRDMIMVQSIDGKLQVFEQSADTFSRQLLDCMYPGPLMYVSHLDAFVTASYAARLECYRYQVLVNAQQADIGEGKGESKRSGLTALRSVFVEWAINLGEQPRQLIAGKFSQTDPKKIGDELLVLLDRSIFLVKVHSRH